MGDDGAERTKQQKQCNRNQAGRTVKRTHNGMNERQATQKIEQKGRTHHSLIILAN